MAGKRKGPKGPELSKFLADVRTLERKGFLRKTGKRGAAKATRYRVRRVKDLSDVITQKLVAVRRSPAIAREFKEAGFTVARGRVAMRAEVARKVQRSPRNEYPSFIQKPRKAIADRAPTLERIVLPVKVSNFTSLRKFAESGKLDNMKEPHELFAFTWYGNNSSFSFSDAAFLVEYLAEYVDDSSDEDHAWEHFEIWRLWPPGLWAPTPRPTRYVTQQERSKAGKKGWKTRMKRGDIKKRTHEQHKEQMRTLVRKTRETKYEERRAKGDKVRSHAGKYPSGQVPKDSR